MIGIITCIRHLDSAQNFNKVKLLLYDTVKTLKHQTNQAFKLYIVCNSGTSFDLDTSINYELIYTQIACPPHVDVIDDKSQLRQWKYVRKDKGFKYYLGLQKAYTDSIDYIMLIDADDYLHKGVVEFIQSHKAEFDGIIVDKGYSYSKSSKFIGAINGFNKICGTCNCFSMEVLSKFIVTKCFSSHEEMFTHVPSDFVLRVLGSHLNGAEFITEQGGKVGTFPFYAVIYLIDNGENNSRVTNIIGYPVLLSDSIIDDFSLVSKKVPYAQNILSLIQFRFLYLFQPRLSVLKKLGVRIKRKLRNNK